MDKNFTVGQSNELISNNQLFDIHNEFNVGEFSFDGANAEIEFISLDGALTIHLRFEGIAFISFAKSTRAGSYWGVEEFGYKSPDDFDDNWLLSESQSTPEDHLFIRLVGDDYIRVFSSTAELRVL